MSVLKHKTRDVVLSESLQGFVSLLVSKPEREGGREANGSHGTRAALLDVQYRLLRPVICHEIGLDAVLSSVSVTN